jgi:hypothetical protein
MSGESYDSYLRLLKLPRNACEDDIRASITHELRLWTRRTNAPTLEARQEAERKIQVLEMAEKVLLGAEGRVIRSQATGQPVPEVGTDIHVDAETVARAIERVAFIKGTKSQERRGTLLVRRAALFTKGVDYLFEEVVHKKYEAAQNSKRCCATQQGLILFDWKYNTDLEGNGVAKTYIEGPWARDIVVFAAESEGPAEKV